MSSAVRQKALRRDGRALAGPDGWEPPDWKCLPDIALARLAQLYAVIEGGAPWPKALAEGVLALVL